MVFPRLWKARKQGACPCKNRRLQLNNQRHVSLTKTARAPGTPQHQAASESDRSVPKRAAALGSQSPGNLLSRYERDGQHYKRGGKQAGVAPWCFDHSPMRTKLRPITAHLRRIPESVVIERWRTEHGRGTRRRRRDRRADECAVLMRIGLGPCWDTSRDYRGEDRSRSCGTVT
jgi:hypothetical protein